MTLSSTPEPARRIIPASASVGLILGGRDFSLEIGVTGASERLVSASCSAGAAPWGGWKELTDCNSLVTDAVGSAETLLCCKQPPPRGIINASATPRPSSRKIRLFIASRERLCIIASPLIRSTQFRD